MTTITGKQWSELFYKLKEGTTNCWCCNLCPVGAEAKKCDGSGKGGWTNLRVHILNKHGEEYQEVIDNALVKGRVVSNGNNTLDNYVRCTGKKISKDGRNVYGWIDFITFGDLPFTAMEKPVFKRYTNLDSISYPTFRKYFLRTGEFLQNNLKKVLPKTFGLIFDGKISDQLLFYQKFK